MKSNELGRLSTAMDEAAAEFNRLYTNGKEIKEIVRTIKNDMDSFLKSKNPAIRMEVNKYISNLCLDLSNRLAENAEKAAARAADSVTRANNLAASIAPKKKKKKKKKAAENNSPEVENNLSEEESKTSASTPIIYALLIAAKAIGPVSTEKYQSTCLISPLEKVSEDKTPLPTVVTEHDSLAVLRKVIAISYNEIDEIDVTELSTAVEKLKNVPRDAEFWKCINAGFLNGSGESFITMLQKYGAYINLFPAISEDAKRNQHNNDEWLKSRLCKMDSNYQDNPRDYLKKNKNGESALEFNPVVLAAMLIVKDLSSNPSEEEKRKVYNEYQIPFSYDKLKAHINYQILRKSDFLEKKSLTESTPASSLTLRR